MADRAEQLLEAVDILFKERIKAVNFDTTINCVIIDASKASQGQYTVSNGSANFVAYSKDTDYEVDDNVLVTIPNGDYDQQKIIIGKQMKDNGTAFKYKDPFSTMIDITHNIIVGDMGETSLYANGYQREEQILWAADYEKNPIIGYDKLGLSGEFSSWLSTYNPIAGSYGLRLEISLSTEWIAGEKNCQKYITEIENLETKASEKKSNARVRYEAGQITQEQYNDYCATIDDQLEIDKQPYLDAIAKIDNEASSYTRNVYLDSIESFYGNVYAFDSYYYQSAVFDISAFKDRKIIGLKLYFYQRQDFKTASGTYIPSPDFEAYQLQEGQTLREYYDELTEPPVQDDFTTIAKNLFVKDPYICFGYSLSNFENDKAVLYTRSDLTYSTLKTDEENKVIIELRWIHQENDDIVNVDKDVFEELAAEGYVINWYRYELGAKSPDVFAGMFWKHIGSYTTWDQADAENANWAFAQTIIPDTTLAQEMIKVIITKDNSAIATSNIIVLTNELDIESQTQTDLMTALGILCGYPDGNIESGFYLDNEQGSFFYYKKGNQIQDETKAQEMFSLTPTFNSSRDAYAVGDSILLTEATALIWTFPAVNTMIRPVLSDAIYFTSEDIVACQSGINLKTVEDIANYFSNPSHDRFYLLNYSDTTKVIYNRTENTIEFLHFGTGAADQLNTDFVNAESIIQHYYIEKTYTPARINNTVECEIIKDRLRYHTTRTFFFGQSGTSGSDYTLVLDFKNNVNALTIDKLNDNDIPQEYLGSTEDNFFYALIPRVRLLDQHGQEINLTEVGNNYHLTFDFPISEVKINNIVSKHTPPEAHPENLFYPVKYNGAGQNSLGFFYGEEQYYHSTNYYLDDTSRLQDSNLYYYYNRVNHSFQKVSTLDNFDFYTNTDQLYRKYTSAELNNQHGVNNHVKSKIIYNAIQQMDDIVWNTTFNGVRLRFFIQDQGNFILDPNLEFNEAETYYYAMSAPASESDYIALVADPLGPDGTDLGPVKRWIHINNDVRDSLTTLSIMDSLSIMRVTLSGFGNYDLVTYYPVPLRLYDPEHLCYSLVGENYIRYYSDGSLPDYYQNPYEVKYLDVASGTTDSTILSTRDNFHLIVPTSSPRNIYIPGFVNNILQPLPVYIPEAPLFGIQYSKEESGIAYWTQPIFVYQDNYPSATINAWDGKEIKTDNETGTILASSIAAGRKESDDTFSGVMIGDWSRTDIETSGSFSQTGLYGFHHGAMSFGFKEDGTGFIGKDGSGRIHLAGDKAQIYSSDWLLSNSGMLLDIDDGFIKMNKKNGYVTETINNATAYNNIKSRGNLYYKTEYEPITTYINNDYYISGFSSISYDQTDVINQFNENNWYICIPDAPADNQYDISKTAEQQTYIDIPALCQKPSKNAIKEVLEGSCPTFSTINANFTEQELIKQGFLELLSSGSRYYNKLLPPEGYTEASARYEITTRNMSITNDVVTFTGTSGSVVTLVIEEKKYYFKLYESGSGLETTYSCGLLKSHTKKIYLPYKLSYNNYTISNLHLTNVSQTATIHHVESYSKITSDNRAHLKNNVSNFYFRYISNPENQYIAIPANSTLKYDSTWSYFTQNGVGFDRFVTLSADETQIPLAIGKDKNLWNRKFRVNWDGDLYSKDGHFENGYFEGKLYSKEGEIGGWIIEQTRLSAINGSVYLDSSEGLLYGARIETWSGHIGAWEIDQISLRGGDTVLHSSLGIFTDNVKIKQTGSGANYANFFGGMGYVGATFSIGNDTAPGVAMYYGQSSSTSNSIYKVNAYNLGFKWYGPYMSLNNQDSSAGSIGGKNKVWNFDGVGDVANFNIKGMVKINLTATDIYFDTTGSDASKAAEHQHGIYARFA